MRATSRFFMVLAAVGLTAALPPAAAAQAFPPVEVPPEMGRLDFLIGSWLGEGKIYDEEGNVTREISMAEMGMGPVVVEPILGGLALEQGAGSDIARTWYTYRPLEKEYVWVAIDMQGHFDHLRGTFEDGRLVLTEIGPQAWRDGGTMMFRRTYQDIQPDSYEVLMEYSRDEGATWILYSRQLERRVPDDEPPSTGAAAASGPPPWAVAEIDSTEGRWIADNSQYQSAGEPYDAYGLEWHAAPGRRSMKGRLFALQGTEEAGTLWEFRLFWHPERQALWINQFGTDGTFGEGALERTGPGATELAQTFHGPAGATWRSGHRETREADRRTTESFTIDSDGNWNPLRVYTWVKQ